MAENVQQQFGDVYKRLEDKDKPFDYSSISITDLPAGELDARYFSGQVNNPNAFREGMENATGYKSAVSYYDMYKEAQGPNRQILSKEELANAIQQNVKGTESLGFLKGDDGKVTIESLDDSPITQFGSGMTYEDKLQALVANQGTKVVLPDGRTGVLPIVKLLGQFDPVDESKQVRLPNIGIDVDQKKVLIKDDDTKETVTMGQKTIFPLSDKSGKGAVVLDFNERVVSFKAMLDKYTSLNQYQKLNILKAQASGELSKVAGVGQLGRDTVAGVGNLALWGMEAIADAAIATANFFSFDDEFKDPKDNPKQRDGGVDFGHITYAAEEFSQKTGVSQDTADLIFRWSPSITETALEEFIAGGVVTAPFQAIKVGRYFLKDRAFRNFIKKKYGDAESTFEEAYASAINKNKKTPAVLIREHVNDTTKINSIAYRNWKANGVMNAIQRSSEYKKIYAGNKAALLDMEIVDARIVALKKRQISLENKRTLDDKWEKAYQNVTQELEDQYSYKNSLFIRNLLPQDLREALTTEAGISYGISLLKNTQQSYFPDSSATMFEIGGVVLGNYATAPISNRALGIVDSVTTAKGFVDAGVKIFKTLLKGTDQQKADRFLKLLGGTNPELASRMEAGILRAEEITTKILSMTDRNGEPLIKEPDIIVNTLANISTLDILRSKAGQLGDKLSVKGMDTLNHEFQRLSENIIQQSELNTQLAVALRELNNLRFVPNLDPSIKNFTEGLAKYLRNSQSQVTDQIAHFNKDIDDTTAFMLMEAAGVKLSDTPGAYTDYDTVLESLGTSKAELMKGLGYNEQQIIKATNDTLGQFKLAVLEGANKAQIAIDTLPQEIGKNISSSFVGNKKSNFKVASDNFTNLRAANKNAEMDFAPIYDQYLNGIEETVLEGSDAAKAIAGTRLPTVVQGKLGNVFQEAAGRMFKSNPKLDPLVDKIREIYPDATDLQIWTVLKNGNAEMGFDGIPGLKLPINFTDYQLVLSSLSQQQHRFGATRQALPVKEIKELLINTAENKDTGFKIGLLQPDGGTAVGPEVMAGLKAANATWQNTSAIYESGIGKKWSGYAKTKLANGMIKYGSVDQDPVNWFSAEIAARKDISTPAGVTSFNNLFSEMASVYGGKLVSTADEIAGTPARYEFIAGEVGTQTFKKNWIDQMKFQMLTNTQAGKNVLKLHKDPKLNRQFLTQGEMTDGRITLDYKEEDVMNLINHMKQAKMRDPKTNELVDMFNDNDIQEIFDSIGIEQLALKSDIARQAVSNVKKIITEKTELIRKGKGIEAQEVKVQIELAQKYGKDLTPDFVFAQAQQGDVGLANLDNVRKGFIKSLMLDKSLSVKDKKLKIQQYDRFIARQFMEKLTAVSQDKVMGKPSLSLDMTSSAFLDNTPLKINPKQLLDGISGGPLAQKDGTIKTLLTRGADGMLDNMGKPIDPDKFYDDMVTIAELVAGKEPTKIGNINLTGIPTGLSVESYISRVYSVARGVVSLKYLMTEAVLQTARVQKFNAFQAMINNPEIARLVVKAIRTGKPLRGDDAVLFDNLLLSAVAKQGVKYASTEEALAASRPAVGQEQTLFEEGKAKDDFMRRQGLIEGAGDTIMRVGPGDVPTMTPFGTLTGKYNIGDPDKAIGDFRSQMEELNFQRSGGVKPGSPDATELRT